MLGDEVMKILVIGNGFDLAHGLPTSYSDFIGFCEKVRRIYTYSETASVDQYIKNNLDNWKAHDYVKKILGVAFKERIIKRIRTTKDEYKIEVSTPNGALDETFTYIERNTWLDYFLKCPSYIGETWIDFEAEISKVIRALEVVRKMLVSGHSINDLSEIESRTVMALLKASKWNLQSAFGGTEGLEKFTDFLNTELQKLIRALEIYIDEIVGRIEVNIKSPDIEKMALDYVLSFNYSDTFERTYGRGKDIEYDYIHGKADTNNKMESNNMVLGIDEYLEDRKDKDVEYIAFKKYYQRILKQTGCRYKEWIDVINGEYEEFKCQQEEAKAKNKMYIQDDMHRVMCQLEAREILRKKCEIHMLYIFGHSLDVTDKDILKELILNENVKTIIFYFERYDENGKGDNGRKDLGQKITNLVKVIGPDELIKRTGGSTRTIEFKLQKEMVDENS